MDFDAASDGVGTEQSPWNTLVGKQLSGASQVTVWLSGEASPLDVPYPVVASPGGVDDLRILSRHLVDPSAERAHFTESFRTSELPAEEHAPGVWRFDNPGGGLQVVTVLRDWRLPEHRPIPAEGLMPGLAFESDYVESFRIDEEARVVLPRAASVSELAIVQAGFFTDASGVYIKTTTGAAPGSGDEPEHRIAVNAPSRISAWRFNAFGQVAVDRFELGGLIVSLNLANGGRDRAVDVFPARTVVVRDMLFVACADDDNIACVNGEGAGHTITMLRNQHIGVGSDGGPIVVSTQGGKSAYDALNIVDQVTHLGYRLLRLDGSDPGHALGPQFALGAFHGGKVLGGRIERGIALAYQGVRASPFQFPTSADRLPADPTDADAYPVQVSDVYIESVSEMRDWSANGVRVDRSYFGPTPSRINGLFRDMSPVMFTSCVLDLNVTYSALGNVGTRDAVFVNTLVRVSGDSRAALLGVGSSSTGRAVLRDVVVERSGGSSGLRFANGYRNWNAPADMPQAVTGWDGSADLGSLWFGEGTLGADARVFATPAAQPQPTTLAEFRAVHGGDIHTGATGSGDLPAGTAPDAIAAAITGGVAGALSTRSTGPTGINGASFSARLGPFQTGHPSACGLSDLAPSFGVVDIGDVDAFITAFVAGSPVADLAAPPGVVDISDVDRFIERFVDGCPTGW